MYIQDWSNFWDDTEGDGYAQLEINTTHPIKLTRIAIRALTGKDKPGVVLIVASIVGLVPAYAVPLYSASKHAVVGFARGIADADRLEGVRVLAICPR
jgi:NAD(P)-dependent dehydrogenase (short-subunit alcohol dehydrogenase family)